MPSRSANNHRYVPEAVQNYNLNPAASVVDKQSRYNPQVGDAAKLKQTAQGLADLAKGITAVNIQLARMAADHTPEAYAKTEDENKAKFAEVSRKVEGFAKFNPYNREVYNTLRADTLVGNAQLKYKQLAVNCENLTPEAFDAQVYGIQTELLNNLKAEGIKAKNSANALSGFQNTQAQLKEVYVSKREALKLQATNNQIARTYGNYITHQGQAGFTTNLHEVIREGNELGRTNESIADLILNTVKTAVVNDPSQFSSAFILGELKTLNVNGKTLSEIAPDLDITVMKLMREIKQADLNDRKLSYESEQFDMQMKRNEIATEWIDLLRSGQELNPREQQQWAIEMSEKYGLDGINSMQLFKNIADGRQTFSELKNIPSDPETILELQAGIFTGETTNLSLFEAMEEGNLSPQDAAKLGEQIHNFEAKKAAKEIKKVDDHIKRTTEEYLKGDSKAGTRPVLRSSTAKQELVTRMNNLRAEYEEGKITYEQFNDKLAATKSAIKEVERQNREGQKVGILAGYDSLRATPEISQEQWEQVDKAKSTLAIRRMGIIRNSVNRKSNTVYIDSAPTAYRQSTGRRHTGYDLGGKDVIKGKAVYSPRKGTVVGVLKGDNGGMGNMVLVKCDNGKLIKYMHLQNAGLPSLGTEIDTETPIGYVGNTGAVENKQVGSLHIECYDKNMQWITAWEFMQ